MSDLVHTQIKIKNTHYKHNHGKRLSSTRQAGQYMGLILQILQLFHMKF